MAKLEASITNNVHVINKGLLACSALYPHQTRHPLQVKSLFNLLLASYVFGLWRWEGSRLGRRKTRNLVASIVSWRGCHTEARDPWSHFSCEPRDTHNWPKPLPPYLLSTLAPLLPFYLLPLICAIDFATRAHALQWPLTLSFFFFFESLWL